MASEGKQYLPGPALGAFLGAMAAARRAPVHYVMVAELHPHRMPACAPRALRASDVQSRPPPNLEWDSPDSPARCPRSRREYGTPPRQPFRACECGLGGRLGAAIWHGRCGALSSRLRLSALLQRRASQQKK
jgi:hypothetical protein